LLNSTQLLLLGGGGRCRATTTQAVAELVDVVGVEDEPSVLSHVTCHLVVFGSEQEVGKKFNQVVWNHITACCGLGLDNSKVRVFKQLV